jgi:hemerythrin
MRAGFDYHVAKPPDIDTVLALVADAPRCGTCVSLPDDIATGHHEVDSQDASILAEVARLRTASPEAVWESLRFLQQHTVSHFQYEEALMEDVGYPELAAHKQRHEDFLRQMGVLHERLERAGATPESLGGPVDTIEAWVIEHVLDQDRSMAEFIRTQTLAHTEADGATPTRSTAPGLPQRRLRLV